MPEPTAAARGDQGGSEFLGQAKLFLRNLLGWVAEEQGESEHPAPGGGTTTDEPPARQAAGIAFIDPQANALFLKRSSVNDHAGEWNFPGGHLENDESPEQAARREATEEVGDCGAMNPLVKADQRRFGAVDYTTFMHPTKDAFTPALNDEHTEYKWAPLASPPSPLHPGVQATLDSYAQRFQGATDPPVSEAQRRAMHAAASGNSNIGIPASVGKEFANADPGGKLPEKKGNDADPPMDDIIRAMYAKDPDGLLRALTAAKIMPQPEPPMTPRPQWNARQFPARDVQRARDWSSPRYGGPDAGTSEGARKAAATRRAHGHFPGTEGTHFAGRPLRQAQTPPSTSSGNSQFVARSQIAGGGRGRPIVGPGTGGANTMGMAVPQQPVSSHPDIAKHNELLKSGYKYFGRSGSGSHAYTHRRTGHEVFLQEHSKDELPVSSTAPNSAVPLAVANRRWRDNAGA